MATLPQPSATACKVNPDTVHRAVDALLKWKASKSETQKPQLIPQDEFFYLYFTLKKIPSKGRTKPFRIPLPYPLFDPSSELCLIIDDRPNSKLTSKDAKQIIKAEGIPISKVIKFSKLKTDYNPFEAKRKLCNSYDFFFTDRRVVPLLPKLLGKQFFRKKKLPLPLDLTHNNWKDQIQRAFSSGLFYMREGTCSVVKVAKVSMENGEIVENVVAAINGVEQVVPKKWAGVRSLHLKLSDSVALPIYQALPDMKLKIEGIRENEVGVEEEVGGELEAKDESEKDQKLGKNMKKKGRIREVRYMDDNVCQDEDELDNEDEIENENTEGDELHGTESMKRKKKKADKEGDLEVAKEDRDDNKDGIDREEGENDDLGSAEFEGKRKKKKKGDSVKGQALSQLNGEKLAKKSNKLEEGKGKRLKKDDLALRGGDESAGAKRKKSETEIKLNDVAVKVKDKKSKKKQSGK